MATGPAAAAAPALATPASAAAPALTGGSARVYDRLLTVCANASQALSGQHAVSSVAACAALCDAREACDGFDSDGASCYLKQNCVSSPLEASLCMHKGLWCGYRVANAPRPDVLADSVVVTQTHIVTPAALRRFVLAQQQLRAVGAQHFVAFLIGDEPLRDRCDDARHPRAQDLASLRNALGREAVWCLDPPTFSARWPDFFTRTAKLPWMHELPPVASGRTPKPPHWRYRASSNSLGWHWSWTNCDLPGPLGVLQFLPRALQHVKWLWTLDWDVGWTGDLGRILGSFADAPQDYLAPFAPHRADRGAWPYFRLRSHLRDDEIWQTLVVPQRFSRRMLSALDAGLAAANHSFCEMRSPSLCAQQSAWCTQAGLADLKPDVIGEFSCCNTITEEGLRAMQQAWLAAAGNATVRSAGRLVHRVRDTAKTSMAALFMPRARRGRAARGGRGGKRRRGHGKQKKQKQKQKQKQKRGKQRAEASEGTADTSDTADTADTADQEGQEDQEDQAGSAEPKEGGRGGARRRKRDQKGASGKALPKARRSPATPKRPHKRRRKRDAATAAEPDAR